MSNEAEVMGQQQQNPTVVAGRFPGGRGRVPMSTPQRKLEVPAMPGYYLKWFRGTAQRLAQAEQAGFEFVQSQEVQTHNVAIGGDAMKDGNSDLGSRVSVVDGSEIEGGQAVRLYLMKQKFEWYLEDRRLSQRHNDAVVDALTVSYRDGTIGSGRASGELPEDAAQRYVDKTRTKIPALFQRKRDALLG